MALSGRAFLAIWHGLQDSIRSDFDEYHTKEHMPERLGIPGFMRGRRFMKDETTGQVCFTLYEGAHAETFRSPAYVARLNDPTPETQRIQPFMTGFMRGVFTLALSLGEGTGGALATLRLRAGENADMTALKAACHSILDAFGVCAVHLGTNEEHITGTRTRETDLRSDESGGICDAVIVLESIDLDSARAAAAAVAGRIEASDFTSLDVAVYRLAYETRAATLAL